MSKSKGTRKERELLHEFRDAGWFCIRSPGSSGGYDLIAAKDSHVIVIELKYVEAGERVYFEEQELWGGEDNPRSHKDGGICGVANDFDGHAYAVVRWKRDTTFYGLPPDLLQTTSIGTPYMEPDEDKDRAMILPPPNSQEVDAEDVVADIENDSPDVDE